MSSGEPRTGITAQPVGESVTSEMLHRFHTSGSPEAMSSAAMNRTLEELEIFEDFENIGTSSPERLVWLPMSEYVPQELLNRSHERLVWLLMNENVPQELLNRSHERSEIPNLFQESYETLLNQLYGIPVQFPKFLIINGIKTSFISFQEIATMLQNNQIYRYIIDPLLQPWTESPYRILTFFGKNGVTYLAKARYNPQTNQILP